jgi:Ca-activated chloride channel family protein
MRERNVAAVIVLWAALGGGRAAPPARAAGEPAARPAAGDPPALAAAAVEDDVTQGALRVTRDGSLVECPLRHTDVQADVSGFLARVRVTQTFENPYDEPIEAVYVFPLPHGAAVDEMTMRVGERRVAGVIRRRAEARAVYDEAVARGLTASLLAQERPNIFTQTVGNIPPRQAVRIEIAYLDVLPYDQGAYEFHFPMVVGPRYIPGPALPGPGQGRGWSPDTTRVPDASRITPPVLEPGLRTGHDVALRVAVEAGVPIRDVKVAAHQARVERPSRSQATAVLSPADAIPNRDFVLTYRVAGERPETALLAHGTGDGPGYFLLMVQPRAVDGALGQAPPRDLCFLIDVSGSMSGAPTAKVVEALGRFFERMRPQDRLQVITFAGGADRLFASYVPATPANLRRALHFTEGLQGGGGTEMLKGVQAVLADPVDAGRVRVVVMLTDGYIGNEAEIIGEVGRRAGDALRFWTIGVGSAPNRFLLDGVARQGGGMSATLGLRDDPTELVERIVERIQRAQLSQVELEWDGLDVTETYPARVPELWAGRPIVLLGRYEGAGPRVVRISGRVEGRPASFPVEVTLPEREEAHAVLAPAWARRKIEDLSDQLDVSQGDPAPLEEEITDLALQYRLMSAYTSFVAVDETGGPVSEEPRPPRRMLVPVPMPEGASYEGVFGKENAWPYAVEETIEVADASAPVAGSRAVAQARRGRANAAGIGGALSGGVAGGVIGGVVGGAPSAPPPPKMPLPLATPPAEQAKVVPGATRVAGPLALLQQPAAEPDVLGSAAVRHADAREALAQAEELARQGQWWPARRQAELAWVLEESYLRSQPWANDGTRAAAARVWEAAEAAIRQGALAAVPALGQRLDLVIRNADLRAALEQVAAAAGLGLELAKGGLEDAATLADAPLRVAWLDLRHATVAQAFTWLAQPFGLEWTVNGARVLVRSPRTAPGAAVWTYAVHEADASGARVLEAAARRELRGLGARVMLLGPGRLLVFGDASAHAAAAPLLAGRRPEPPAEAAERRSRRALVRTAATWEAFSWALLAAACERGVDDEAVAEMLEAGRGEGTLAELGRKRPGLALRAVWTIAQARAVAPEDATVARLWEAAAPAVAAASRALAGEAPAHGSSVPAAYLALLRELPAALRPPDLAAAGGDGGARARLDALARRSPAGDDEAVLAGLAHRLAGKAAWDAARDRRATEARAAGISAGALRVLSRLESARLAGMPETKRPGA